MNADRFVAKYLIETPLAVERAAEIIASEQSSGTFVPPPGETAEAGLNRFTASSFQSSRC